MTSFRGTRVRASALTGRGWLGTGGEALSLEDLRGKIVVLDFWTFCCVNCLHVLDELRDVIDKHKDTVVLVGIHSPKFAHEADPAALAAAIERYTVDHPVLDDPELTTWQAYGARAWPTLVVIDPDGYIVAHMSGEGHGHNLDVLITQVETEHEAAGTLHRGNGPYVPPAQSSELLNFPGKAVLLPNGHVLVADAGHHSLAELDTHGSIVRRIGTGQRGHVDADAHEAEFSEPAGLCLLPADIAVSAGVDVIVADTVNHALRGVNTATGHVVTLAGTGAQKMPFDPEPPRYPHAGSAGVPMSSPWDVAWSDALHGVVVAMAGIHELWLFDPIKRTMSIVAGTENEGLVDGPGDAAWLAQPSGLSPVIPPADDDFTGLGDIFTDVEPLMWFADAETSSLRLLGRDDTGHIIVKTAVGAGLFDFGHVDGPAGQARFQHPLGVCAVTSKLVAIADTYNGAIRLFTTVPGAVATLATGLAEPSGMIYMPGTGEENRLIVVESAAHRLIAVPLAAKKNAHAENFHGPAQQTKRPRTTLHAGKVRLSVPFTPAAGQKYDDRFGPAVSLSVSATPPELLITGHGETQTFDRVLELTRGEGTIHVSARVASCDADPHIENPACHLNSQDWGVPVRVIDDETAPNTLVLPLLGTEQGI